MDVLIEDLNEVLEKCVEKYQMPEWLARDIMNAVLTRAVPIGIIEKKNGVVEEDDVPF